MLNLKELEEKLDAVLANETEETLTAWIEYKRSQQKLKLREELMEFGLWLGMNFNIYKGILIEEIVDTYLKELNYNNDNI